MFILWECFCLTGCLQQSFFLVFYFFWHIWAKSYNWPYFLFCLGLTLVFVLGSER